MPDTRKRIVALGAVLFALYVLVCLASYFKGDIRTNDFERFDDLRLTVAFFILFAGICAAYVALSEEDFPSGIGRIAWIGAAGFAVPLLLMFPVGSRDVFAYVFFGKMWGRYGANPYLQAPSVFRGDPWFGLLEAWWKDYTITYGPLFTYQTRLAYLLTDDRLAAAIGFYKIVNVGALAVSAWILDSIRAQMEEGGARARERVWMLWLWSPLVLFESLGSGHNDLLMTVLLVGAVASWLRGRRLAAWCLWALSFWYKWYSVVLVPVWLAWSMRRWGLRGLGRLAAIAAVLLLLSAAVLAPLYGSLAPMVEHMRHHQVARLLFPTELPPPLWVVFHIYEAAGIFSWTGGESLFALTRLGLFVAGMVWVIWRRWGSGYRPEAFVEDSVWTLGFFFFLAVPALYPWHLLPVCALAIGRGLRVYERFAVLLTVMGLLSYFLTFTVALLLCVLIVAALALLRSQPARLR